VRTAGDGIVTDVTLTTIMPTLRASIPEPLEPSLWPAHTVATTADVCIAATQKQSCNVPGGGFSKSGDGKAYKFSELKYRSYRA
jgi:hypothetical protein